MNALNSSGVLPTGVPFWTARFSFSFGALSAFTDSSFTFFRISGGRFFGATRPYHASD